MYQLLLPGEDVSSAAALTEARQYPYPPTIPGPPTIVEQNGISTEGQTMADAKQVQQQAELSLERLWPRMQITFRDEARAAPDAWQAFETRLRHEWERLFGLLLGLYGGEYDFFYHLEELLKAAARSWFARPTWLKQSFRGDS